MLVLIAGGTDKERARKRRSFAPKLLEELDPSIIGQEELATIAGTSTLTGELRAFFLRGVLSSKSSEEGQESGGDRREAILAIAKGLAESPHTFIFEEEKTPVKAVVEQFKKAGATIEILQASATKKEPFNVFALADALAKQDRKQLWLLLVRALRDGIAPENIAGVLAWKARTILAAARDQSTRAVLEKNSRQLVALYHDSHRGMGDLGLLLERFALNL